MNSQRYIFQYHCLVNSWGNATIEVCALNRSIFGNNIFFISNTNNTDAFLRRFLNNHTKTDSLIGFRNIYNSFWMLGYCAEYDSAGGLVQDNYDLDCQQRHPPCPALYNSAKAYQCKLWFHNFQSNNMKV